MDTCVVQQVTQHLIGLHPLLLSLGLTPGCTPDPNSLLMNTLESAGDSPVGGVGHATHLEDKD